MSPIPAISPKLRSLSSKFLPVAFSAAMLCVILPAHAASLITDGGFESATGGNTYYAGNSLDGSWTVGAKSVVYIDNQDPYVFDAFNSVNLTALNVDAPNSIFQVLSTVVGKEYEVSFWANADSPNSFLATASGVALSGSPLSIASNGFPDPNSNSALFTNYTGYFTATSSSTTLALSATAAPPIGSDAGSVVLDDVSAVAATPEPSSIVLTLTGVVGILAQRRRLKKFVAGS